MRCRCGGGRVRRPCLPITISAHRLSLGEQKARELEGQERGAHPARSAPALDCWLGVSEKKLCTGSRPAVRVRGVYRPLSDHILIM